MVWGGMNNVEPPYTVKVVRSSDAPLEVREYIDLMVNVIREAREWKLANTSTDTDVSIEVVSLDPHEDQETPSLVSDPSRRVPAGHSSG
jgi:hypothetical protein